MASSEERSGTDSFFNLHEVELMAREILPAATYD